MCIASDEKSSSSSNRPFPAAEKLQTHTDKVLRYGLMYKSTDWITRDRVYFEECSKSYKRREIREALDKKKELNFAE